MKSRFLKAALTGIAAGAIAGELPVANAAETAEVEKCWGIQKCKGTAACGVGKSDIEATKAVFKDKFAKTQTHDCSGSGTCSGVKGQLGWLHVAKGHCTKIENGFLIAEQKGKKAVVKE